MDTAATHHVDQLKQQVICKQLVADQLDVALDQLHRM